MSDSENQRATLGLSREATDALVAIGRASGNITPAADFIAALEATITTLKAQLTAAEGKAAGYEMALKEARREVGTHRIGAGESIAVMHLETVRNLIDRWLAKYPPALSAPASSPTQMHRIGCDAWKLLPCTCGLMPAPARDTGNEEGE